MYYVSSRIMFHLLSHISVYMTRPAFGIYRVVFFTRLPYLLQETGWLPQHIVAQDENKNIIGVVPLYLKRFTIHNLIYLFIYFSLNSLKHLILLYII